MTSVRLSMHVFTDDQHKFIMSDSILSLFHSYSLYTIPQKQVLIQFLPCAPSRLRRDHVLIIIG